jgi:glycosyltransferase involved in cell wall biosynthesis
MVRFQSPDECDSMPLSSFIVVTHKFTASTQDDLVSYLDKRYERVLFVWHDFADSPNRRSFCEEHCNGVILNHWKSRDYRNTPELVVMIKDFAFAMYSILRTGKKWDVSIGLSGFDALPGILLKKLNRVSKTVFWAGDFVPKSRFGESWKNMIYFQENRFVLKRCDYAWNISPRIEKLREILYGIKSKRKQRVVPIGIWTARRVKLSLKEIHKHRILFVGHLLEKQGVQLVLKAIPEIRKKIIDFEFLIIGKGNYESSLKSLVKGLGIDDCVIFAGYKNDEEMERLSSQCACAVAPYDEKTDTWTRYADPGKIKNYLASGLPVILTDVPYNAREVQEKRCGFVIKYNVNELAKAILTLIANDSLLEEYRNNAFKYSKQFDWNNIFNGAIAQVAASDINGPDV